MSRSTPSDAQERFAAKYVIDPETQCWVWTAGMGFRANGVLRYARFWYQGETHLAHNVAYMWWGTEPYDPSLTRDHLCMNTHCVNPEHLEQVPLRVNIQRYHVARTTCPQGHEYDAINNKGSRFCRTCANAAQARWKAKVSA